MHRFYPMGSESALRKSVIFFWNLTLIRCVKFLFAKSGYLPQSTKCLWDPFFPLECSARVHPVCVPHAQCSRLVILMVATVPPEKLWQRAWVRHRCSYADASLGLVSPLDGGSIVRPGGSRLEGDVLAGILTETVHVLTLERWGIRRGGWVGFREKGSRNQTTSSAFVSGALPFQARVDDQPSPSAPALAAGQSGLPLEPSPSVGSSCPSWIFLLLFCSSRLSYTWILSCFFILCFKPNNYSPWSC